MLPPIKMSPEEDETQNTDVQGIYAHKILKTESASKILNTNDTKNTEKYGLRPRTIIKRLQQETKTKDPPEPKKKIKRSKSRTASLSKYKRKTANSRERDRMKEINIAFESLRKLLPEHFEVAAGKTCSTKIMTLKTAVAYIQALAHVLEEGSDVDCLKNTIKEEKDVNNQHESSIKKSNNEISKYILHSVIKNENDISTRQSNLQNNIFGNYVDPFGESNIMNIEYDYSNYDTRVINKTLYKNPPKYESFLHRTLVNGKTEGFSPVCQPHHNYSIGGGRSGSLSSNSELDELLSEDSHMLEEHLDVFQDFTMINDTNPLDIFLSTETGYN